jgi:BTB/POZ domain
LSFPTTILAASASNATLDTSTIFVDRDSKQFACIIDYMRDGEINLPGTASKDAVLAFYGFENLTTEAHKIKTSGKVMFKQLWWYTR